MMRGSRTTATVAAMLSLAAMVLHRSALAAQTPRTVEIGGFGTDTVVRKCSGDSVVAAALAAFNNPVALHMFGGGTVGATVNGSLGVYRGAVRIDSTVHGDVVVLNGELRVQATAIVTGNITVLGGHSSIDPRAKIGGTTYECEQVIPLARLADGTVVLSSSTPSLNQVASILTWKAGPFTFSPHLGIGQYNRSEGLPIEAGVNASRGVGTNDSLRGTAYAIVRTARDASASRPSVGWHAEATFAHNGWLPYTVTLAGGSTVQPTVDRPFPDLESGLSALVFRRDYTDWFLNRGASVTVAVRPIRELSVSGRLETSHQTTVVAADAFSLLRSGEAWRPNPLIDDGHYQIATVGILWDARSEVEHPVLGWLLHAQVRHISSNSLTPVTLQTSIRDALPTSGYGASDGDIDLRGYLRLNPEARIAARIVGGGYLGGDPLTIQDRRAIGGADPLLGYDFRGINCDRRHKIDPAMPALCDRTAAVQAEYHRTLPINLNAQVGRYTVGIRKPDLVLLGDIGTAWLAGDSAGRVPAGKIQALREWRSDVGVGITSGAIGLYIAKALSDPLPVRFSLLFSKRF